MSPEYRPTRGPARERVSDAELESARSAIVPDERRRRSLYFDGRFLAARDLTRDQAYFLTRQADLGAALGGGVVTGLRVRTDASGSRLFVSPGHGITPSGELVLVRDSARPGDPPVSLSADLADLPAIERLDAAFGLSRAPRAAARNRTGTFVVALRPVEYTANPIAQYPTSLHDRKSEPLRDGDIVEAVALSLIPFEVGRAASTDDARARAGQAVFLRGGGGELPVDALPLAMVGLSRGVIEWLDEWLVRRELTDETSSFGLTPRSVRAAFVRHYLEHLDDVISLRARSARATKFAAAEHFLTLPPAGRVPAETVAARGATLEQTYFPPEIDVDLSIVPRDELPLLLEDAIALPPIDLTAGSAALESIQVSILVPVPREDVAPLRSELSELSLRLQSDPAARLLRQRPLLALRSLKRIKAGGEGEVSPALLAQAWVKQLERVRGNALWYVRRRTLPAATGVVARERPGVSWLAAVGLSLAGSTGEGERLRLALERGSPETALELVRFVIQQRATFDFPMILSGFVSEIEGLSGDPAAIKSRYGTPLLGTGIKKLTDLRPQLNDLATRRIVAGSLAVPELDALARPAIPAKVTTITTKLLTLVQAGNPAAIRTAILNGSIAT